MSVSGREYQMNKHQLHERRLTVDCRESGLIDHRAMIRFEPDNEPRRSGHDRRVSEIRENKRNIAW